MENKIHKISDSFRDLKAAYYEDMRNLYNKDGVLYEKYDPRRNTHTHMTQGWWNAHDEENPVTNYFEGF